MSSNGLPPASQANRAERPPLSMRIRGQAIPDQKPGPNDSIDWRDTAFYNQSKGCVDIPFSSIDHPNKVSWADILKWKESQERVKGRRQRDAFGPALDSHLQEPAYNMGHIAYARAPNNEPESRAPSHVSTNASGRATYANVLQSDGGSFKEPNLPKHNPIPENRERGHHHNQTKNNHRVQFDARNKQNGPGRVGTPNHQVSAANHSVANSKRGKFRGRGRQQRNQARRYQDHGQRQSQTMNATPVSPAPTFAQKIKSNNKPFNTIVNKRAPPSLLHPSLFHPPMVLDKPDIDMKEKNYEWIGICRDRNAQTYNSNSTLKGVQAIFYYDLKKLRAKNCLLSTYYWSQVKATLREDLFDLIRPTAEMTGSLEALKRYSDELDTTLRDTPLDRKKNAELEEFLSAKEEVMKLFNINQQNSRVELYNKLEDENTELGQKYKQLMTVLEKNVSEEATKKDNDLAREAMKRGDEMQQILIEIPEYCYVSNENEDRIVERDYQLMIEKKKKVALQWYQCGLRAVNEYIPFYDDENEQEGPDTRLVRDLSLKIGLLGSWISVIYGQALETKPVNEFYEVNNWMVALWWRRIISKGLNYDQMISENVLRKQMGVKEAMLWYLEKSLKNFELNLDSLAEIRNKCFDYIFFISIVHVINYIDGKYLREELDELFRKLEERAIQESIPRTELVRKENERKLVPFYAYEVLLPTRRDLLRLDNFRMSIDLGNIQLVDGKLQARTVFDIRNPCPILLEPLVAFKFMNDTFCGMCHQIVGDLELGSQGASCPYCRRSVYCHEVCRKTARDIGLHSRAVCSNFVPERMSIAAQLVFQTLVWAADNGNVGQLINELLQHFAGERPFACNLAELKPSDYKDSKQWKKFALACLFGDSMAVDKPQDSNSTVKQLLINAIELRIKLEKTFPQEDGTAGQHTPNKKALEALLYRLLYTVSYRNPLALSTLNRGRFGGLIHYGYGLAPLGQAFSFCCARSSKANVVRRFYPKTGMVEYWPTRDIAVGERLYIGPSKMDEPKNIGQGKSIKLEKKAYDNLLNAFKALCDCGNCDGAPQP